MAVELQSELQGGKEPLVSIVPLLLLQHEQEVDMSLSLAYVSMMSFLSLSYNVGYNFKKSAHKKIVQADWTLELAPCWDLWCLKGWAGAEREGAQMFVWAVQIDHY